MDSLIVVHDYDAWGIEKFVEGRDGGLLQRTYRDICVVTKNLEGQDQHNLSIGIARTWRKGPNNYTESAS